MKVTMKDLYVGQTVTILKRPPMWSSALSAKCPLSHLTYPFTGIVEALQGDNANISGYGFSINYLDVEFKIESYEIF